MFSLFRHRSVRHFLLMQMFVSVVLANMNPIFAKYLFGIGWRPLELYLAVLIVLVSVLLLHEFIVLEHGEKWGMTKEDFLGTLLTAFFGGFLGPMLFYWGLHFVSASDSIILTSLLPFFVVCFAVLFLGERFRMRELLGGSFLLVAIVIFLWRDLFMFRISIGVPIIIGSSLMSACTIIIHKKFVKHRHLDSVMLMRNGISLLLVAGWMLFADPSGFGRLAAPQNIWIFLALPVCSYLIPFFLYFRALKHLTAMDAGMMEATGRVFGLLAATVILGETLRTEHFISMVLIVFGLVLVNVPLTKWRIVPSRLAGIGPLRK